ncbi:MAG: hypothetical protein ABSA49_11570 [Rhizomicrobium sp.]|jgi:hypothetical protein
MTKDWTSAISRRPVLAGILGVLGIAVVGGIAYEASPRRRYKPSPFDDLLSKLSDRENASRVGAEVVRGTPGFNADRTKRSLRAKLADATLGDAISADLARDRLVEVRGWVLPETFASLCALAAKAA